MYCPSCGKEIKDNSKFCLFCGTKIDPEQVKSYQESLNNVDEFKELLEDKKRKPLTKKAKIAIASIVGVIVAFVIVFALIKSGDKVIDPFDGLILRTNGYDGYGYVSLTNGGNNDTEMIALENEYYELEDEYEGVCQISAYKTDSSAKCTELKEDIYNLGKALDSFNYEFSYPDEKKDGNLNNGDIITATITYDEKALKNAGYKLKSTSKEFTVEGLMELEKVDLFANVDLEWVAGWNTFQLQVVDNGQTYIEPYDYEIGDVTSTGEVIVKVSEDYIAGNYGLVSLNGFYDKTFYVGRKPEMITQINSENKEKIKSLAVSVLTNSYLDSCNLRINDELIITIDIEEISINLGIIKASYIITTDQEHTYKQEIEFQAYEDSDGSYKNLTDFSNKKFACELEDTTIEES